MHSRSIRSLTTVRAGLLSAIGAVLPDDAMSALVDQLCEVEERIIAAPCSTYEELAVKARLLAEKLADEHSIDPMIGSIIEQLPRDLEAVERQAARQVDRTLLRLAKAA